MEWKTINSCRGFIIQNSSKVCDNLVAACVFTSVLNQNDQISCCRREKSWKDYSYLQTQTVRDYQMEDREVHTSDRPTDSFKKEDEDYCYLICRMGSRLSFLAS